MSTEHTEQITITGIGWVTSASFGPASDNGEFRLEQGELPSLSRDQVFASSDQHFGRMDPFSRLGVAGVAFCLRDAGLDSWTEKRNIGIVAATTGGCLSTDLAYFETVVQSDGAWASPHLFAYTLSSTFLGESSIRFGLTGPDLVIHTSSTNSLECLHTAVDLLEGGGAVKLVAGTCDVTPPDSYAHLLGETLPGALFFMLEKGTGSKDGYGTLRRTQDGRLVCGEEDVTSLTRLVTYCLQQNS